MLVMNARSINKRHAYGVIDLIAVALRLAGRIPTIRWNLGGHDFVYQMGRVDSLAPKGKPRHGISKPSGRSRAGCSGAVDQLFFVNKIFKTQAETMATKLLHISTTANDKRSRNEVHLV